MTHGMRKTIVLILFVTAALPVMAQRSADYGFSLGMTNYLGEKNPVNFFNSPSPAAQLFYRYNLNPRQALRANLLGGSLRNLKIAGQNFNGALGELGVTYEYNFFPYSTMRSRIVDYTPYIAAGAAFSMVYNQAALNNFNPFLSIPFSAGIKVNIANNVGLEFEYGFRKTFNDKFDGLEDMPDPVTSERYSWIHNSDWYSFMGVSVTWKLYNKLAGCPAFAEIGKDKKRKK
jgi:hypothetical protein